MKFKKYAVIFGVLAVAAVFSGSVASATHSWNGYHWARTANPFTLKVGDNVSSTWDPYLNEAIADWSASPVLDLTKVTGSTNPRTCKPKAGQIEACSERYGNTGWLGIARIWISGSHITQAITKVNDTYFNTATYNTPAWRRLVMCQEIAHDFGLDHQDEVFNNANLGSCMDYTNDPDGGAGGFSATDPSNEHPNAHDFEQIETIYAHLDTFTTIANGIVGKKSPAPASVDNDIDASNPSEWGKTIRKSSDGRSSLHERDLGKGNKVFTFVIWANENR